MLGQREGGAYRLLCYWLAPSMQAYLPEMMDLATVHHGKLPALFQQALEAWQYLKALVRRQQAGVRPRAEVLTDGEMVSFTFPAQSQEKETVWLLASFFVVVWRESVVRGRQITAAA